jgi:hypothetical protein
MALGNCKSGRFMYTGSLLLLSCFALIKQAYFVRLFRVRRSAGPEMDPEVAVRLSEQRFFKLLGKLRREVGQHNPFLKVKC